MSYKFKPDFGIKHTKMFPNNSEQITLETDAFGQTGSLTFNESVLGAAPWSFHGRHFSVYILFFVNLQ